jgi:hypothetical protein
MDTIISSSVVAYIAKLLKFVKPATANLDKQEEQFLEPYLEIAGNFILLNPTNEEARKIGYGLPENHPQHPNNQSSMFGFGSSIRE